MVPKSSTRSRSAYNCDTIQPSFDAYYIQDDDYDEFLTSLKTCNDKYYYESGLLSDYASFDFSGINLVLRDRYIAEYSNLLPPEEALRQRPGSYTLVSKVVQDFLLFHYHVESKRWKDALADCKNGLIPNTVVTKTLLNTTLYALEEKLKADNLEFSISPEFLSAYFKIPIADCAFRDDSFVIHIQAPVKTSADWKLLDVRPLPFYNPKTPNESETICTVGNVGTYFLYDNKTRAAFASDCKLGELCHVAEATERPYEKSCATATLLGEIDFIPTLCDLKCHPVEYFQLPIFRKLASDRFVLTDRPGNQFVIQCPNKGIQIINFPALGAVEVILPCDCEILYDAIKIPSRHPCVPGLSKAEVFHLIPEHWSTENFNYPDSE
jgi:hypothetical protein